MGIGAVVDLQFPDGKREGRTETRKESVAGLLILLRIEPENRERGQCFGRHGRHTGPSSMALRLSCRGGAYSQQDLSGDISKLG